MRSLARMLLRYRDVRLLLAAGLISTTGDWILLVGLAYQVYRLTGSTLASGVMMLAATLPPLLLGTVAGTLVDRWSRRGTLIVTNLLLAAGLLPLLAVRHGGQVWIVYLVVVVEGAIEQFFTPAQAALLPHLVPEDQLVAANALNGQTKDIARLAGAALGGVAVGFGGLAAVALLDAASFLFAAALLALIRIRVPVRPVTTSAVRGWLDGLRVAARSRPVRVVLGYLAITTIGEGVMLTLLAPWVADVLHAGSQAYGVILSVQAIGGLVGGLVAAGLGGRLPARALLGAGSVLFGLIDLALFLYPLVLRSVWPAGVLIALAGLPSACAVAGLVATLQLATTDGHRGRVFGAVGAVTGLGTLLGAISAGLLADRIGIVPVIAEQGAGYLLGGILILTTLPTTPNPQHSRKRSRSHSRPFPSPQGTGASRG